jgi:hypothetical protein
MELGTSLPSMAVIATHADVLSLPKLFLVIDEKILDYNAW